MATLPIAVPGSLRGKSEAPPPNVPLGLNVQQIAARTLWGITFIGFGMGLTAVSMLLALVFVAVFSQSSGAFLAALGFPLLTLYPGIFGRPHVVRVRIAMTLAVIAVIVGVVFSFLGPSSSEANVSALSLRLQLLGAILFVLLGSVAIYLVIDRLATLRMRLVAAGALAATFVVQVVAYVVVNGAIDANLPLGLIGQDTPPLYAVQRTWAWWGALNAIPLLLFLAAYEVTYWRLRRRYIPSLSLMEA